MTQTVNTRLYYLITLLMFISCAESPVDQTKPGGTDDLEELPEGKTFSYQNAIRFDKAAGSYRDEVRDPFIIREGDTYYLIHTMYPFTHSTSADADKPDCNSSPGIRMYESKDLLNWTVCSRNRADGFLVKSSDLPENCPYKHRFWAPEIHKIANKFYLVFTANNWIKADYNPTKDIHSMNTFIAVADQVYGPYQNFCYVEGGACDLSLFEQKSTGRVYAYIPAGDIYVQQIDLSRIAENKISFMGTRKKVVTAKNENLNWDYKYLEGPIAIEEGGKTALFFSGLRKDNTKTDDFENNPADLEYWTGVAYADSPVGPFLKTAESKAFYGGHVGIFKGANKKNWFSYRGEKIQQTRGLLCIDPFYWDKTKQEFQFTEPTASLQQIQY